MHLPAAPEGSRRGWKMTVQLAIEGGEPVRRAPFPPWPVLGEEDVAVAAEVLRSGRLTSLTSRLFSLQVHPTMQQRDLDDVIAAIEKVAAAYRRRS